MISMYVFFCTFALITLIETIYYFRKSNMIQEDKDFVCGYMVGGFTFTLVIGLCYWALCTVGAA